MKTAEGFEAEYLLVVVGLASSEGSTVTERAIFSKSTRPQYLGVLLGRFTVLSALQFA